VHGLGSFCMISIFHKASHQLDIPALSSFSLTKPFSESHTNWPFRIGGILDEGAAEPSLTEAARAEGDPPCHRSCMYQS
jgi:hypothetical protein